MAQNPRPSNIDRALVQAPNDFLSIEEEDLAQQEDDFLNVEVVENDEGAEVSFGEEEVTFGGEPENFYDNLAPMVSDATLTGVASYVLDSVEDDRNSRDDWEDTYVKGLDLLGMRYETRTEPFDGATGVIHPLLNEAVTQFQSQAYKEMLPSSGPVRANIVGTPTPDAEQQAQRVQDYMNYQIMYEMEEYEPEFDQMLYYLGLAGSAFKKVYRDEALGRPVSKFIPAEDVLVPYVATDLKTAELKMSYARCKCRVFTLIWIVKVAQMTVVIQLPMRMMILRADHRLVLMNSLHYMSAIVSWISKITQMLMQQVKKQV